MERQLGAGERRRENETEHTLIKCKIESRVGGCVLHCAPALGAWSEQEGCFVFNSLSLQLGCTQMSLQGATNLFFISANLLSGLKKKRGTISAPPRAHGIMK
jgi:hypothetical protein